MDDMPEGDSWTLENFQRNALQRGLEECKIDDILVLTDVDEIVSPSVLTQLKNHTQVIEPTTLVQIM